MLGLSESGMKNLQVRGEKRKAPDTMKPIHTPEYTRMRERLKAARKAAGMTQEQVAEELDRPQSFVSKVESGERRIDPTELEKFARLYKKPLTFFLSGD
jgi:ribosome-binding protein aMBF1 (putative translation factor)